MTACGYCAGTLRTGEQTFTAWKPDGTKVTGVCLDCITKYRLANQR
jgi:hypothetical protein